MATCIKCGYSEGRNTLAGDCSHCGTNRGWEFGDSANGGKGVFCLGCGNGYTSLDCPKCGHKIEGNDLNGSPETDLIVFVIVIVIVLFIVVCAIAGS